MPAKKEDQIQIQRIGTEVLRIPIVGTTPLIVHRFSEKAKKQMLDNMQGRKGPKEPKDPMAEYLACFYRYKDSPSDTDEGPFGFPSIGYKECIVSGARLFHNVTMVGLRQFIFVHGELGVDGQMLTRIDVPQSSLRVAVGENNAEGDGFARRPSIEMREDVVRVGQGGTDLRYRPMFQEWNSTLEIRYVKSMLTRESVLSLVEAGGMTVGVGEWRPEKKGDFGTFAIDPTREIEALAP